MAAPDLTTLPNVKSWLGLTANTDDTLLSRMVTALSQYIQTWLNRQIASASYAETRDGTGRNRLVFADYPVTAVSSVTVDGVPIPASTGVTVPGYFFDDKSITLRGYVFTKGQGNVVLSYTAGYASTPVDLEQACIELIAFRYRERDRIGHSSKSLGGEVVSFTIADFPVDVKTILNNYKKVITL